MKLYLKQKIFSWLDRFTAKDADGNDCYTVEGKLAFGKQLTIYDGRGSHVAFVRQRFMPFLPRFDVEIGGQWVCTVQREMTLFSQHYTIEGLDWWLSGDFIAHEYSMTGPDGTVMDMRRALFTWGDSYELDIHDPGNALLCLAIAIAVDACIAVRRR